jgi:hypothetical protein
MPGSLANAADYYGSAGGLNKIDEEVKAEEEESTI